uniref:Uncharacterized protein n=1 Tax=Manihot esculenta TaxID=3983 RepID=A0A199UA36_MANES
MDWSSGFLTTWPIDISRIVFINCQAFTIYDLTGSMQCT